MSNTLVNQKIVILGGGTAGWMAANLMATHWIDKGIDITLVESPDIGTVGVGEGSTPPLKHFMETIGADEAEWMKACNATYKVGIDFRHWSTRPGFERYIHPFLAQPDDFTAPAFFYNSLLRRKGIDLESHPDHFFLASRLVNNKLSPKAPENFPFEINYGYHFDSGLLGKFLHKHAQQKSVKYKQATVSDVVLAANGNIDHLVTEQGEKLHADIFVDASGFRGTLIQEALKVPFRSFADNLFNDAAVVFATEQSEEIESQTISTALRNGWAWKIPLTNRNGNGYVYSKSFCSPDAAETEMRAHLGLLDSDCEARHLNMKVGRTELQWAKNCVAVGLSQGFVEPLEATALDMVQETVFRFIEAYQEGGFTDKNRDGFNQRINGRIDAVRDYIVCHYKINTRTDSEYWKANAANNRISPSLHAILTSWMKGESITDELERQKLDIYFPNVSWNCLLAGKGIFPNANQLKQVPELQEKYKMADLERFIHGCSLNFKPHHIELAKL